MDEFSCGDFANSAASLENENTAAFETAASGPGYLIQSREEIGLDIFYKLLIARPRGREFWVNLPWQFQEICPPCQGQGRIYSWNAEKSAYETSPCEECGGQGAQGQDSEISLLINDDLCGEPIIRRRKAGRFRAGQGHRGDLIINITWVDELPGA